MWNSLYRRFCLLTVLSALSVMAFAQSVDENFDRAEQLYKEQNFKKAVVFYKKSADDGNVQFGAVQVLFDGHVLFLQNLLC